jgi:hypothetical protein
VRVTGSGAAAEEKRADYETMTSFQGADLAEGQVLTLGTMTSGPDIRINKKPNCELSDILRGEIFSLLDRRIANGGQ